MPGAKPHPGALVQSAAMASVLPPAPTYTPNLPKEVITKGLLSIAQIEAVVYAGQAHSETLPNGERRGYFIGDGTGVGKGREISGILLDNIRQGRKLHVWVSEKQGLMNDAKRDFSGVGGDDSIIFNQNKTKAEDDIQDDQGILFTTYSTLRSGAQSQATNDPLKLAGLKKAFPEGTPLKIVGNTTEWEVAGWNDADTPMVRELGAGYGRGRPLPSFRIESIDGIKEWKLGRPKVDPKAGKKKEAGQSRLDQLVKRLGSNFDGVIVFDEAHNAGNAVAIKGERGFTEPSAQAMAVVQLQQKLPKARIVYVSATGATQVSNLSYATRLGLWGEGTPFPAVNNFIDQMTAGGLATMELVARDMKQMGAYIARSLSFDGVSYSRVEHELTPLQRDIYDRLADGWQVTLQNFMAALELTGAIGEDGRTKNGRALAAAKSAYWGAQQRFFNQIITSMQMPTLLEQVERDLAAGEAVVMQLVNTNEAQQTRALAKKKEEGETELEDLDLTPRDQLIQMVEKSFPVVQFEDFTDEDGKKQTRPVLDAAGNPVQNKAAVRLRDKLLNDLKEIRVPDGPLELILNHFGSDRVAEVTGRTQRVVRKPDAEGNVKAQLETRGGSAARADADSFMADKKQILVFSDAGGTGFSFQADLSKINQRKRKHYLIQPGWRADKAVQGFGRTHRTNQKSAPHYGLVSTDIPAQKRFLSSIARRLDQLGALTKGQRDTANQGLFSEKDNLESQYATQAVRQLLMDLKQGQIEGLTFNDFLKQMGLEDIVDAETGQIAETKYPPTRQFLNRMLSLRLDTQTAVFNAFIQRMEEKVELAAARGMLDTGMQTIRALETKVLRDEVVHTDARTGAETRYVELELTLPNRIFEAPAVPERGAPALDWRVNVKSGRVWAVYKSGTETTKDGNVVTRYRLAGTNGTTIKTETDLAKANAYRTVTDAEARAMWDTENAARPRTITETRHMITGALLPIWDRISTEGSHAVQVARTQTEDGRRLLGRLIPKADIADTLKRLNVDSAESKLAPAAILARVLKGETGELANGWRLERARVSDDLRVELKGSFYGALGAELTRNGVIHERISWADRYFIPTGPAGADVLAKVIANRPLVKLDKPGSAAAATEDEEPAARRSASSSGASVQAVETIAKRIAATWENPPNIVVVDSLDDPRVPDAVRALEQGHEGADPVAAVYDGHGNVFLVASRLRAEAVPAALMHESLGHFGLRGTYGSELGRILDRIAILNAAKVREKAQAYKLDYDKPSERRQAAEEVLASMAETNPQLGWVQKTIAAIRTWLREHVPGYKSMHLSDNELIQNYLLPARRFVTGEAAPLRAATAPAQAQPGPDGMPAFSRKSIAEQALPYGYVVGDLFNSAGRLHWWHKSVGTQFNLAQRSPTYKRVYDAGQEFLNDASRFGNEQGDLAPNIIPRLESWRDIFRSPLSAADTKAIAAPIFEGTLSWTRDAEGKPVRIDAQLEAADQLTSEEKARELFRNGKVSEAELKRWQASPLDIYDGAVRNRYEREFLKPGVVWTDDELRSMFKLSKEQIGLYREFREAVNRSLADLATSEMLRLAGKNVDAATRTRLMDLHDHDKAAIELRDMLWKQAEDEPKRAKVLNGIADKIVIAADHVNRLQKEGYAPLSRFGHYTLDVVDEDGARVYFGMFETAWDRSRMARKMAADFPKAKITQGTVSQEAYKQFAGVSPETIQLFGEILGLDSTGDEAKDLAFQEAIKRTTSTRSAMRRLLHRKGIAGFSEDSGRVLAGFIVSNSRRTSSNLHMGELEDAVEGVGKVDGQLRDAAERLREYIKNPREEAPAIRGMLFTQYLGGSIASAMVNATQPFTVTWPWLTQFGGIAAASRQLKNATADALKDNASFDPALRAALHDAEERGIVSPQEIHQMMAQAAGRGHLRAGDGTKMGDLAAQGSNALSKLQLAWGKVFSIPEQFNRRITFIAAYRTAIEQKIADPAAFAERAVAETQFTYNKGNKPQWARGAIGATLFTFKQYSVNYLELLGRMWQQGGPEGKRAALLAIAVMFVMGGASGLPFMGNVEDLIDGLMQRLGYNFSTKRKRNEFFANILGQEAARFLEHGVSGLPGVPIDISGRMSMGRPVPATGLAVKKSDHGRDVQELLGPVGDLAKRAGQATAALVQGDVLQAANTFAPTAVRNMVKGVDMLKRGMYRDDKGRKVLDTTAVEAAFKMLGFQPATVARIQDAAGQVMAQVDVTKIVTTEISDKLAQAIFEGDQEAKQAALALRNRWNADNPDARISLNMPGVLHKVRAMRESKEQRLEKATPKGMRATVRAQLSAAE